MSDRLEKLRRYQVRVTICGYTYTTDDGRNTFRQDHELTIDAYDMREAKKIGDDHVLGHHSDIQFHGQPELFSVVEPHDGGVVIG